MPKTSKQDLIAALKADHGIDVEELQAAAQQRVDLSALADALKGTLSLSGDGPLEESDVVGAIVELNAKNEKIERQVLGLLRREAERVVDGYISEGRLLAHGRDQAIRFHLDGGDLDSFLWKKS